MTTRLNAALIAIAWACTSSLALAVPVTSGSFSLDRTSLTETVAIDASGHESQLLEISILGGGSMDACGDLLGHSDCIDVRIGGRTLAENISITSAWQETYSIQDLLSLSESAPLIELTFDSIITGSDESMTVFWQIPGATQARVAQIAEPLTVSLFGLGLAAFGLARRRQHD